MTTTAVLRKEILVDVIAIAQKDLQRYRELTLAIDSVNRNKRPKKGATAREESGFKSVSIEMASAIAERSRLGFAIANAVVGLPLDAGRGR